MKKRITAFVLAVCLLVALTACGVQEDTSKLLGSIESDVYRNEYLELTCELPSGWRFYSKEEMAEQNQLGGELLENENAAEWLEKAGQLMDMMMADPTTGSNVNLLLQKTEHSLDRLDDAELITRMQSSYETQFASAGFTITEYQPVEMTFCGQEKTCLRIGLTVDGMSEITEYQVFVRTGKTYYAIITLALMDDTDPQTLMNCFRSIAE